MSHGHVDGGDVSVTFFAPVDLVMRIDAMARRTDRTRSSVIRELLRRATRDPNLKLQDYGSYVSEDGRP